jgi:hypothetical protein
MIELGDFISTTLTEIFRGVRVAQKEIEIENGAINPRLEKRKSIDNSDHVIGISSKGHLAYLVEFDVAVTSTDKDGRTSRLGVVSSILKAGMDTTRGHDASSSSRIRFTVPLALPEMNDE